LGNKGDVLPKGGKGKAIAQLVLLGLKLSLESCKVHQHWPPNMDYITLRIIPEILPFSGF